MGARGVDEVYNGMNNKKETSIKEKIGFESDIIKGRK